MAQSVYRLAADWTTRDRISTPVRGKNLLSSASSSPVLGPTQPSMQFVPGAISPGVKRPRREADRSRIRKFVHALTHTSSWRNA
jgi:hypothetical protein